MQVRAGNLEDLRKLADRKVAPKILRDTHRQLPPRPWQRVSRGAYPSRPREESKMTKKSRKDNGGDNTPLVPLAKRKVPVRTEEDKQIAIRAATIDMFRPDMSLEEMDRLALSKHQDVVGGMRTTLETAIKCGEILEAIKLKVGYGNWLEHRREHLNKISERQCQAYMRAWTHRDELKSAANRGSGIEEALEAISRPRQVEYRVIDPPPREPETVSIIVSKPEPESRQQVEAQRQAMQQRFDAEMHQLESEWSTRPDPELPPAETPRRMPNEKRPEERVMRWFFNLVLPPFRSLQEDPAYFEASEIARYCYEDRGEVEPPAAEEIREVARWLEAFAAALEEYGTARSGRSKQ
jgi:hypothetical protein